jgi:hypothetical protein
MPLPALLMPKPMLRLSSPRKTPIGSLTMIRLPAVEQYQEALLGGMKEGGRKAINMSEISEVLQRLEKSWSVL